MPSSILVNANTGKVKPTRDSKWFVGVASHISLFLGGYSVQIHNIVPNGFMMYQCDGATLLLEACPSELRGESIFTLCF